MNKKDFTFILPAAGKSIRFKTKKSKIFYNYKNKILISYVIDKCLNFTKNIIIISNRKNLKELRANLIKYKNVKFKILIQKQQRGMGHAINIAMNKVNTKYSSVIWSDQIYLSIVTIKKTIDFFLKKKSILCFPVYKKKTPYVYIVRDKSKNFKDIIQTRETNKKVKVGESDCGFFVFQSKIIRRKLKFLIKKKLIITKKTKEIDFLKSFKFLNKLGRIDTIKANSYKDTIGINYLEDLI
jgi:bifunctional N-acetylglucosamine-1-phosphate-uridyltransferase/glucosamine-1-phosphate-acetyltransferase GlmU-like protein|tara:strand:- start:70 stop:789 length:720 start_codon:yes stop_codon:yes gene_type:complete